MDANKTLVVFIHAIGALLLLSCVECQITSSPDPQTTCSGTDVNLEWVYGNPNDFASVTWTYISSSLTETTIMEQTVGGGDAQVINNFNVKHQSNGAITLKNVNTGNSGSYKISVTYLSASPVDNTVSVTVNDCSSTTVPPTAPTSPPTPSTTTISPVVIIVPSVVGVFVIVIICIIVCILLRKKSNRGKKYRADPENEEIPQVDINVTKQQ